MGLTTMASYDTDACAALCDGAAGCEAFNVYAERDPSLSPNLASCPNPPSTTKFRCTLWGVGVDDTEAINTGQFAARFHLAVAASNGRSLALCIYSYRSSLQS